MCGIGVQERPQLIDNKIESIESIQDQQEIRLMSSLELVDSGCCFDSVNEIANKIFSNKNLLSICSSKFTPQEIEIYKNCVTNQISLECMDTKMEEIEINHLFNKYLYLDLFEH